MKRWELSATAWHGGDSSLQRLATAFVKELRFDEMFEKRLGDASSELLWGVMNRIPSLTGSASTVHALLMKEVNRCSAWHKETLRVIHQSIHSLHCERKEHFENKRDESHKEAMESASSVTHFVNLFLLVAWCADIEWKETPDEERRKRAWYQKIVGEPLDDAPAEE